MYVCKYAHIYIYIIYCTLYIYNIYICTGYYMLISSTRLLLRDAPHSRMGKPKESLIFSTLLCPHDTSQGCLQVSNLSAFDCEAWWSLWVEETGFRSASLVLSRKMGEWDDCFYWILLVLENIIDHSHIPYQAPVMGGNLWAGQRVVTREVSTQSSRLNCLSWCQIWAQSVTAEGVSLQ